MRWRASKSTPHCLAISHVPGLHKRAAPAARELRGARHAVAGGVPEVQAGLPRIAAALHKARSGSTPSTGSAGHRMGRGKGALASPLRLQRTTDVQRVLCARLRLKKPEEAAWGSGRTHDAGRHAALQARGLRGPQRPASPAPRGPARRRP